MSASTIASGLQIEHVSKAFGPVLALSDVTLTFAPGAVTALMGENGAGKSTLLRIIHGDHVPDAGRMVLDGVPLSLHAPRDAHRAGIRVIAQEPEIVPHVSVAENVYVGSLPRRARVLDRQELNRRVQADLADLGFERVLSPHTVGRDLSPAQRQIVEILRAVISDARVIAFDEPTSSLSEHEVAALFQIIRRLRDDGRIVIYVSHRLQDVFEISDQVVVLRDGRHVADRDTRTTNEQEVVRLMVGRDLSSMFAREHASVGEPVLEVRDLTTDDVRDVSFTVHAGEVVVLAGLVGAGRSELAHALVGDLPVRGGEIRVGGRPLRARQPKAAVRGGIGLAPEERKSDALFMDRSIRDNISLVVLDRLRRLRFVNRRAEHRLVEEFTRRLRVRTPSLEQLVSTLSGGNQQKVVLARWLARRPKLLILDEPTRGIDVGAKVEIYDIVQDLAHAGVALLVISSDLLEVLGLADRVLVMQHGHLTGELSRADATEEKILALAMADDLAATTGGPA
ncbi:MAG: sugar ABC transporter ATP-binding protein [bacterium]